MEKTCVIVKPDGVLRGLTGEVIRRFEQAGLKVVALKMIRPTEKQIKGNYPGTQEWFRNVGEKSLKNYRDNGMDPIKELGTEDAVKIGKLVESWIIKYWMTGPVVAMVLEGNHAVETTRMIVGYTMPATAAPGTIRGDFSVDSPILANLKKRPVKNMVHASGTKEEAENEIHNWFKKEEIIVYKRADEDVMFE